MSQSSPAESSEFQYRSPTLSLSFILNRHLCFDEFLRFRLQKDCIRVPVNRDREEIHGTLTCMRPTRCDQIIPADNEWAYTHAQKITWPDISCTHSCPGYGPELLVETVHCSMLVQLWHIPERPKDNEGGSNLQNE